MAKKRKGKRKGQHGNGKVTDLIKRVAKTAKEKKLLSKALGVGAVLTGNPNLAKAAGVARMAGYGQHGNGIFSSILGELGSGLGMGVGNLGRGLFGRGRNNKDIINV